MLRGMNQIRQVRQSRHLTQAQLGLLLGVQPATVGAWESGTIPRQRMQRKLARQLGVTEDELGFGPPLKETEAD